MLKGPKGTKLVHMPGMPRNVMMRVPEAEAENHEAGESAAGMQPEPPAWLDADARSIFRSRAKEIDAANYWQPRFVDALALFASLMAEYQRGPAQASAAKVTQMRLLLSELGLTPLSSRGVTPRR